MQVKGLPSSRSLEYHAGAAPAGEDYADELLPAAGLVTSSDEYYPTVAINALMRTLRDPSMASQHPQVRRVQPKASINCAEK